MNSTERAEEAQIEMACSHPDTLTYKLARIVFIGIEMSDIQVQLRDLTKQHANLQSERYLLECEVYRAQ